VCGTLEPLQTATSIDGQVQELQTILKTHGELPITLVGHSWGAWLSFIFTSLHPGYVRKLILVGSGPFEEKYVPIIMETRLSRFNDEEMSDIFTLNEALNDPEFKDKNETFARLGELISRADSFKPLPIHGEKLDLNYDIFQSVWNEASKLRQSGKLLELGKYIQCPIVAIHGDYDPHPSEGVEEPLSRILNDFRFILLKNCGHYPWLEQTAKERFFEVLKEELG
jgi:pimeloyl-ACP methyl ester carboxylesterase